MKSKPPGDGQAVTLRRDQSFLQVPAHLFSDRTLHPIDVLVACWLVYFDRGAYCAWPCNATLAKAAGCSVRTVQYALARLEAVGWIVRQPAQVRRGQVVRLNWRRRRAGAGVQTVAGGDATRCTSGTQPVAPNPRFEPSEISKKQTVSVPTQEQADAAAILDPKDVAYWTGIQANGPRSLRRFAANVLQEHAEATARTSGRTMTIHVTHPGPTPTPTPPAQKESRPPGNPLAEDPETGHPERPILDTNKRTTKQVQKSSPKERMKHKLHKK